MSETQMDTLNELMEKIESKICVVGNENSNKFTRDLIRVQDRLYMQLEALSWLQQRLSIKGQLPPLRGWATSPDILLKLHTHIMTHRPKVIVEFGSGASTLVMADALRQNGLGKLISIEHSIHYGKQTQSALEREFLQSWVDLRIGDLEVWNGEHLHKNDNIVMPLLWYPLSLLKGIEFVDLVLVDGPPGATCRHSRYPALPALSDKLSSKAEIWMDDTIRKEERDICEQWSKKYGLILEYYPMEKGLGRLISP
ncbi:O-methyltransferase [Microbulbifer sp. TRSA005]|uniref:O-methyltransferase n=1 Tax=unclassified Microbulbifer TaxID=2619833 RepID=UPI0040391967